MHSLGSSTAVYPLGRDSRAVCACQVLPAGMAAVLATAAAAGSVIFELVLHTPHA